MTSASPSTFRCPVCGVRVTYAEVERHIEEVHSDPEVGVTDEGTAADRIRAFVNGGTDEEEQDFVDVAATATPGFDPLGEIGIRLTDVDAVVLTTETGASLTGPEARRVFTAIEEFVGFRIDRAAFIVNFIDWGIRNGFTEELADAGGFTVRSHSTVAHNEVYYRMLAIHNTVSDHFSSSGSGRTFTFRRLGRFLAKEIPKIVDRNPQLSRYYGEGSPMSNRLGIPPANFLTCTSIFEYIKPYRKWTSEEKAAWNAHNKSIVKQSNVQREDFMPTDLRPSPSQAETFVDNGTNDFAQRHTPAKYGRGGAMWEKMIAEASKGNPGRQGIGYS